MTDSTLSQTDRSLADLSLANLSLAGKVAVVTGGGRGLGRGVALELARNGAAVVINDFFVDEQGVAAAQLVADEITTAGGRAAASTSSVTEFATADEIVQTAVREFGRLDILVTSAGNFARADILTMDQAEWDQVTSVHMNGHMACLAAAAKQMVKQGDGGRIVTVSSRGGLFGSQVAYAGAKAAIMGLSSAAARELAPHGITVNCLLPSAQTQLFTSGAATRRFGGMPETLHMEPEYIAPLVTYLCTPAAADVTGRFLYASGTDICSYVHPLMVEHTTTFVRRTEGWTVRDIADTLPAVLGLAN